MPEHDYSRLAGNGATCHIDRTVPIGASIVRDHVSPLRAAGSLAIAAGFAAFIGCAPPIVLDTASAVPDTTATADKPPTVELRYFPFSPTVSVVAWRAEDADFGLRTWVRRDGSLVRDHRLYVGTYFEPWVRSLYLAAAPPRQFEMTGVSRDTYACYFGKCSPFETIGVRIPDEFLREIRDSVAVTLYGRDGRELTITIRRDLIDAYLTAVDSVTAEMRRRF